MTREDGNDSIRKVDKEEQVRSSSPGVLYDGESQVQTVSGLEEDIYIPTEDAGPKKKRNWWMGILAVLGLLFGKLKLLLGPLYFLVKVLKLSKFLTTGLSMIVMIASYAYIYGWKYAIGIVLLIFVHEMGHLYFAKLKKLDVSLPVFIPFVGAFIKLKQEPQDAKTESFVALGGPLVGMVGAFACFAAALFANSSLWGALAYFGFFITVFNMIPVHPLDGGRIAAALSPVMWIVGIIVMAIMLIYYFNPIALLILIMAVGKAWKVWKHKGQEPEGYYDVDKSFRIKMGLVYFSIFAVSSFFTYLLHELLKG